jgi:hypothetical protein
MPALTLHLLHFPATHTFVACELLSALDTFLQGGRRPRLLAGCTMGTRGHGAWAVTTQEMK